MSCEPVNELSNFICPICKLLYYGDKCLHRYTDVILFQAAEISRLTSELTNGRELLAMALAEGERLTTEVESLRLQLEIEKDYE